MSEFSARKLLERCCFQCWKSIGEETAFNCGKGCGARLCSDNCRKEFYSKLAVHDGVCVTALKAKQILQKFKIEKYYSKKFGTVYSIVSKILNKIRFLEYR